MKFSALILLSFLPVAIAQNISVRLLVDIPEAMVPAVKAELDKSEDGIEKQIAEIAENRRALAGQDRIDTEMVKVEEVFATELPTPADPDHRALRGQNRELPSCTASLCDGYGGYAICRVSCLPYLD